MLTGKKAVILLTSGGDYRQEPYNQMDFVTGYLQTIFGFIGFDEVAILQAVNMAGDETQKQLMIEDVHKQINNLF